MEMPSQAGENEMGEGSRLGFIDAVRGLILALMALDHTSVFWNEGRVAWEGLPVFRGGALVFIHPYSDSLAQALTRAATHMCAPGFIFLAGMMIAMSSLKKDSDVIRGKRFSAYLRKRGLLFVILEITLIQLIWGYGFLLYQRGDGGGLILVGFGIISLFGFLFILLSFLRRLPTATILILAAAVLLGYWTFFPALALKTYEAHCAPLIASAPILYLPAEFGEGLVVTGIYPIFPWISVMFFGVAYGRILARLRAEGRMDALVGYSLVCGACLLCAFAAYKIAIGTPLSKYPPSFDFLALTLGCILLFLGMAQYLERKGMSSKILSTLGRVPFFFYVTHLLMYSLFPSLSGTYAGYSLATTYLVWLGGLPILYVLCRWYYPLKQKHRDSVLKYI